MKRDYTAFIEILAIPMLWVCAWFYAPYAGSGTSFCLWNRFLGLRCPGCGLTRAFCYLARGELISAVSANPLIIPVLLLYISTSVSSIVKRHRSNTYLLDIERQRRCPAETDIAA